MSQDRRDRVFRLLSDGEWHSTMAIEAVDVGGAEGTRRLRELRSPKYGGYNIVKRRVPNSTQWEYRMVRQIYTDWA